MTEVVVLHPDELSQLITEAYVVGHQQAVQSRQDQEWMTVKEAAEYLRCGKDRIYQHTSRRTIPFHKEGDRLLFRKSELLQWVEDGGSL